jgi:hypothetical protein
VQTFVIAPDTDNQNRVDQFLRQTSWKKRLTLTGGDGMTMYVFVPADAKK